MADEEVRYNLRLPAETYAELGKLARERGTTRLEMIRKAIQLGLYIMVSDDVFYVEREGELERILIV